MKKALLFLLIALITTCVCATASNSQKLDHTAYTELFNSGNENYNKGDFENAIIDYTKIIIDPNFISPNTFFNIGRANQQLGKKGYALYWYLKARKYMPRDKDVNDAINSILSENENSSKIQFYPIIDFFTLNELAAIILFFFFLTSSVAVFSKLSRSKKDFFWIYVISWTVITLTSIIFITNNAKTIKPSAVIVNPSAELRITQNLKQEPFEILSEGTLLTVISQNDNWIKVRSPKSNQEGWVMSNSALIP